ncbi:MAG TPA: TIGR03435 family protein [Bryobacteraceae bacterium]|nr:TIGR03435 family protein [Bryobacteraceae bacterium]
MKSLLLLLALPGAILGQALEGTWQGTLTPAPNREIRIAFNITKDGNAYRGLYYNIEAGRQLNLGAITLQGNTIKILIPGMGGTYEGKFEADGNSITGALTQGAKTLPLPLKRANSETAWELPATRALPPLPEGTKLEFEVASIKPANGGRPVGVGFNVSATELRSSNISVAGLITFAFELHLSQVVGLPAWAGTDGYEIGARLPQGGDPTDAQLRTMLKNLLQSRFGLAFHTEKRELPVYAIGIGKNGPSGVKMTTNTTSGLRMTSQGLGRVNFQGATMGALAAQLQLRVLDRPVIDQTGLKDRYDFTLDWRPDEFQFPAVPAERRAAAAANNDALPDLFTAFQEQLGLKLQLTKAPVTVLAIDQVSRPSEN